MTPPQLRWLLSVLCAALAAAAPLAAQDIHFAHLAAVPMQTNPAYTGLLDHRARASIDYRGQWNNFTNGFRTASVNLDGKLYETTDGVFGVGGVLTTDKAGDLNFSSQQLGLSAAYLKTIDRNTFLSFGLNNTFNFRRIDWTDARAFAFEPVGVIENRSRVALLDVGAGLAVFRQPRRGISMFAGIAGHHLNTPTVTFLGDEDGNLGNELYTKWTGHAGAEIHFGRHNSLRPSVIYYHQGPARQLKVGTFWRFRPDYGLSTDANVAVHFGAYLRSYMGEGESGVDAMIFAVRFDYHDTILTVSFDTNVSQLRRASNGFGGPELSLVQEFDFGAPRKRRSRIKCPTMQY